MKSHQSYSEEAVYNGAHDKGLERMLEEGPSNNELAEVREPGFLRVGYHVAKEVAKEVANSAINSAKGIGWFLRVGYHVAKEVAKEVANSAINSAKGIGGFCKDYLISFLPYEVQQRIPTDNPDWRLEAWRIALFTEPFIVGYATYELTGSGSAAFAGGFLSVASSVIRQKDSGDGLRYHKTLGHPLLAGPYHIGKRVQKAVSSSAKNITELYQHKKQELIVQDARKSRVEQEAGQLSHVRVDESLEGALSHDESSN